MGFLLYFLGSVVLISLAAAIASALGAAPVIVNVAAGILLATATVLAAATRNRAASAR